MLRKPTLAAMVAIVALAGAALPAVAQISPGTTLTGEIDRSLNSKDAQVGQSFLLTKVHSSNHDINGGTVYGHVASVQRAGQGTPGKINLAYDKINTRSGNVYQLSARTENVTVQTKSNAGKEAGAAAGGALIGGLLGHGAGAIIGGGAGYVFAKNSRQNVTIPQGSLVNVQIIHARRQTGQ